MGPPRRPRRSRTALIVVGSVFGAFILIAVIAGIAGSKGHTAVGGSTSPAATTAGNSATAVSTPSATRSAAPKARTVATFTGSGIQKTPRFTVTATWKLVYSFSCASFGQSGNFAVLEDGGTDLNGVTVNDLAMSKSASTWAYSDAGSHYLEIDSECAWKVRVVDEP